MGDGVQEVEAYLSKFFRAQYPSDTISINLSVIKVLAITKFLGFQMQHSFQTSKGGASK